MKAEELVTHITNDSLAYRRILEQLEKIADIATGCANSAAYSMDAAPLEEIPVEVRADALNIIMSRNATAVVTKSVR